MAWLCCAAESPDKCSPKKPCFMCSGGTMVKDRAKIVESLIHDVETPGTVRTRKAYPKWVQALAEKIVDAGWRKLAPGVDNRNYKRGKNG